MAVPILNTSLMGNISLDKLPSEADFLNLLWFHTAAADFTKVKFTLSSNLELDD